MDPVIVDTDVMSYLFKSDTRGEFYRPLLTGVLRVVSFMTVAELYRWAEANDWGAARRERLDAYLQKFVIVGFDLDLCRDWAVVSDSARRKGRPIQAADAWIAATAISYGLPLVTNNPGDYAGVEGLRILTA